MTRKNKFIVKTRIENPERKLTKEKPVECRSLIYIILRQVSINGNSVSPLIHVTFFSQPQLLQIFRFTDIFPSMCRSILYATVSFLEKLLEAAMSKAETHVKNTVIPGEDLKDIIFL